MGAPVEPATPAPGQRMASTGTGIILGRVIDAGTGRPISGARVIFTGAGDRAASLAAAGLISILDVEMGMVAGGGGGPNTTAMTGYLAGASGLFRHAGPSRPIELEEGERRTDVVIRMWRYAAISGVVVDEAGEPVVGVGVQALRRVPSGSGPRLQSGSIATSDDRGQYRLSTLAPGARRSRRVGDGPT